MITTQQYFAATMSRDYAADHDPRYSKLHDKPRPPLHHRVQYKLIKMGGAISDKNGRASTPHQHWEELLETFFCGPGEERRRKILFSITPVVVQKGERLSLGVVAKSYGESDEGLLR